MAGYTNAPTRTMALRFGASVVYTEMAGVEGLVHEHSDLTWQLLETLPEERGRAIAHLYGRDPGHFARAAERIAATGRFTGIDINAGCPVPKVTACGAGSALMREPALVREIVAAASAASGLPVSVKTRLGFHPGNVTAFDILHAAEDGGAAALSIHGRYKSQGHAGPVDLALVARVRAAASIPVFGNGGVNDAATASRYAAETGVAALLVGQASIGHPWVFREIREGRSFGPGDSHSSYLALDEIRRAWIAHLDAELAFAELIASKYPSSAPKPPPEEIAAIRFRVHLFRYGAGLRGTSYMRGRMSSLHTRADCVRALDGCLECERRFRARRGPPQPGGLAS
ncbi:MAG: tRNA-dihydrouridine synthase family protein [Kiritimatiellae bacterium]|nr:tRNA-dihydrouridine synthase family protein [Kiritimatiellia bacterium]